jgi:hypothetical protein
MKNEEGNEHCCPSLEKHMIELISSGIFFVELELDEESVTNLRIL